MLISYKPKDNIFLWDLAKIIYSSDATTRPYLKPGPLSQNHMLIPILPPSKPRMKTLSNTVVLSAQLLECFSWFTQKYNLISTNVLPNAKGTLLLNKLDQESSQQFPFFKWCLNFESVGDSDAEFEERIPTAIWNFYKWG